MTLDEIQTQIALDFDSSSSALVSTNSEYSRRTKLINRFEKLWATRKNYAWNALLKETSNLTVSANASTVSLPADFTNRNIQLSRDGFIKLGSIWHKFIRRDELDTYPTTMPLVYVLGNDAMGYTLHVRPTATEDRTLYLNYYSDYLAVATDGSTEKALLVETTDITKCPSPYFLIYSTLATLFKSDDEIDKGLDYERLAEAEMDQMMANENQGMFQQDLYVMEIGEIGGYKNLGE